MVVPVASSGCSQEVI